jgi:hypothetical protein
MPVWVEKDGMFDDAGDVGGDAQAGKSYNRRWWHRTPVGEYAVLDIYTYPAYVDWLPVDPDPARLVLGVQINYTLCIDLNEPGSTETWGDATHAVAGMELDASDAADQQVRRLLENVNPACLGWGGSTRLVSHQSAQAYCRALSGDVFLRAHYGDGYQAKIDVETLDIDHDCFCLLGQLGGQDAFEATRVSFGLSPEDCVRLGFFADTGMGRPDDVELLNAHWRRLLAAGDNG